MFCIQDSEMHGSNSHNSRRILRSFRSHKSLKSATRSQDMAHQRRPSDASTLSAARSSAESSRPSTSSRPARIVDWDPLRLHPPLAKSHLPFAAQNSSSAKNAHRELRQARSLHHLHGAYTSAHVGQPEPRATSSRTVIYDGFDFGFDQMASPSRREPMHDYHDDLYHQHRPSSPGASSTSSGGSDFGPETPSDAQFHFQGLTPRPHVAGLDAADHYIKRGGWKRRGIVFETEVPMASEEECFDLEMD
ncbi:hypothetical protein QBC37DRAFT_167550 [Rhypophila decipiens]|uniref:Uncharacterized protein n=1 Tax=Rhypophila decipiens TaxID=261697 RepID=A0AAN6YJU0_9PEZI|nr:hypothetical protein QBC37DRAFT_167550 [Rhypophila decipiens]